jgi:hypothetical protein
MTVDEQIAKEFILYVEYCRKASLHDEFEDGYRAMAHKIFYHIQELKSTRVCSPLDKDNS